MQITTNQAIPSYPKIVGNEANISYPCYAEIKLDGEANVYYNESLTSKASGKIRRDFPVVRTLSWIMHEIGLPNAMLFGELFWGEGKAGALYDFLSHQKDDNLRFCIFDIYDPTLDGKGYEERREAMISILDSKAYADQDKVLMTKPHYLEVPNDLLALIASNKLQGWEGLVVKNKDSVLYANGSMIMNQTGWVKIKHKATGDYVVSHIDPIQERMDVNVNGRLVGCKLVNKYRPFVHVGDVVEITHMGILSNQGLRHPSFTGKIVSGGKINP